MVKLLGVDGEETVVSNALLNWPTSLEVPHAETYYVGYDPRWEPGR